MFVPVRKIMTCCADDIRFYGYPCRLPGKQEIPKHQWMHIKAKFGYEAVASFGSKQPVLYLIRMEPAEKPEEEIVYLG